MVVKLNLLFSLFIYVSIIILILFIIAWIFTRKFNNKYRNIYALFIDVSKREIVLYATIILNFLITLFFLIFIEKFNEFSIYMIIFTNVISCLTTFNYKIIFSSIIYTFINIQLLWLLNVVNNYLTDVSHDNKILVLKILFMFMIFIFILFTTIRRFEICLKSHKIRRFL